MNRYSPQAALFHAELLAVLRRHMAREREDGREYFEAAIDASAIVGELLLTIFAPIESDKRAAMVALFCRHLPPAVERARAETFAQTMGSALQ